MLPLTKGRYTARVATTTQDIDRAMALRHLCFITNRGLVTRRTDADAFDAHCDHILVEDIQSNTLVSCFRVASFPSGVKILTSYSAQFYDLKRLSTYRAPMAELGRFCIHPDHSDPNILRIGWGALTRLVDASATQLLFGCTSFQGADPALHHIALDQLKNAHRAPTQWQPGVKSPHTYPFAQFQNAILTHPASLPPLLRTYLTMGGWVSDHAVIDETLNTLHVFTGLEIAAIPPARARALRAIAALT